MIFFFKVLLYKYQITKSESQSVTVFLVCFNTNYWSYSCTTSGALSFLSIFDLLIDHIDHGYLSLINYMIDVIYLGFGTNQLIFEVTDWVLG